MASNKEELSKDFFKKAFEHFNFNYSEHQVKVTKKSLEFFQEIGLSEELINFLQEFSLLYVFDFDRNYFDCVNKIRTENLKDINKKIYQKNLLIIGSGINGDPIVVNTKTMTVGYVSHDELWSDENGKDLNSMYIDLNLSIGEFFYKSSTEKKFPVDIDDAREFVKTQN